MRKAELLKKIPKKIPKNPICKIVRACGKSILMISGYAKISNWSGLKKLYCYHFTWNDGYLTYYPNNWEGESEWCKDKYDILNLPGFGGEKEKAAFSNLLLKSKRAELGEEQYWGLYHYERDIDDAKKEKSNVRRQKRIDEIFKDMPILPKGFHQKCKNTAAGSNIKVKLFQQMPDERKIERMFDCSYDSNGRFAITEICRAFSNDWGTAWTDWYYGIHWRRHGKEQHFCKKKWESCISILPRRYWTYDNLDTLNMSESQKSVLRAMDDLSDPAFTLWAMNTYPEMEILVKNGFKRAISEEINQGTVHDLINNISLLESHQLELAKKYNLGSAGITIVKTFPKLQERWYPEISKIKNNIKAQIILEPFRQYQLNTNHYLTLLKKTGGITQNNINRYLDYLDMAKVRHMNVKDEIVYRNKRWREFHDRYVEEINRNKQKKEDTRRARMFSGIKKDLRRNTKIFGWTDGKYQMIVPKSFKDIVEEGNRQHHCVGASDTYMSKMAKRSSWIIFLRHCDNPTEPYYTIETDGTRILQFYAAFDRQPDREKVSKILQKWLKSVKKNKTKVEKEEAAECVKKLTAAV